MPSRMHDWNENAERFAHTIVDYVLERMRERKDTTWRAGKREHLRETLAGMITEEGVGAPVALDKFHTELLPACSPLDDRMNLAYVPAAPSVASTMFDLVVGASSIFGGMWEVGAGAIAAENQALRWLSDLAGYPEEAGGVFVSGGSAANLSALVTARHWHTEKHGRNGRLAFAATREVHSSARAAARVMDVDVVSVDVDERGLMTADALRRALDETDCQVFAVATTAGTTNAGLIDPLNEIADVCDERDLWLHVDGAYGIAGLCSPTARPRFSGIERSDSFGVDPHKWLFAPYDCAALVYRDPSIAPGVHTQHGDYLAEVDRDEWNPADYAYHLSRRVRGMPLWFGLATYGTNAYADAVEQGVATAFDFARRVEAHPGFELLVEPELSVVLFKKTGWELADYQAWTESRAIAGITKIVPTSWKGEPCYRICVIDPRTDIDEISALLDDMMTFNDAAA